ncbi:unnamed protein product [Paramecium octaurelia]|uniref:Kinase domain protein n=1 Tax=Paramecium octaurelia TaxID=43137 RepID=A0A8S1RZJ0_PAROT|nr:unnamed protein product [Paramecium octaurelia]
MKKLSQQVLRNERRLKPHFQIEIFQQQQKLDDQCIEKLSSELILSKSQKILSIDLIKKWHLDLSNLTDRSVKDLSLSLSQLSRLDQLNLGLYGWGYWNENITDSSLNYLTQAILFQDKLSEFKLDLNMWAYENQRITDKGVDRLLHGISLLNNLGSLELNMKGWGDGNYEITDNTIIGLSECLKKLKNLSEIKLILWKNIGLQATKQLNRTLSNLKNLTKIEIQFESCSSQQQAAQYENVDQRLFQIKVNAIQKRKLLFQVEGILVNLEQLIPKCTLWDIILKL